MIVLKHGIKGLIVSIMAFMLMSINLCATAEVMPISAEKSHSIMPLIIVNLIVALIVTWILYKKYLDKK